MNNKNEEYEPTNEEWIEIEEAILREEKEEIQEAQKKDHQELENLKIWMRKHGILWDIKNSRNVEKKRR